MATTTAYHLITEPPALAAIRPLLDASPCISLDVETTGLSARRDRLRLLSLATDQGTWLIDCFAVDPTPLWPVLARKHLIAHNALFDLSFLSGLGFTASEVRDTMLLSQVLYAGGRESSSLQACVQRELNRPMTKDLQLSDWSRALSAEQLQYAALDAEVLCPLEQALQTKIDAAGLSAIADIENRCLPALLWLTRAGVHFDPQCWQQLTYEAAQDADRLAHELDAQAPPPAQRSMFGDGWNWDSPQQVKQVFQAMGCPIESTNDSTLAKIDHPLAELLRQYRSARKRCTTYGTKWLAHVCSDGRIYAQWYQIGAPTGRMACSSPNLQQLPRGDYRRCFVAPPGRLLVKADYSQIELRIAAKVSGDERMLQAYRDRLDLHHLTAQRVLGIEQVSKQQRQLAKAVNFGLLYGMGAKGFQRYAKAKYSLPLTEQQAADYRTAFFRAYPGLADWHRRVKNTTLTETRTLAGRRCLMDPDAFDSYKLNTPIQGTGADGLKRALGLLLERRHQLPGAFPVLVVHDEIVIECAEDQGDQAGAWLRQAMVESMADWLDPIPVEIECHAARSWIGS